jgi:hypothetical protein
VTRERNCESKTHGGDRRVPSAFDLFEIRLEARGIADQGRYRTHVLFRACRDCTDRYFARSDADVQEALFG